MEKAMALRGQGRTASNRSFSEPALLLVLVLLLLLRDEPPNSSLRSAFPPRAPARCVFARPSLAAPP